MSTWIVLLRGINVGGKNIVKMAELKNQLTAAGFTNVQTYIQSGNVVVQSALRSTDSVSKKIATTFEKAFGFAAKIFVTDLDFLRNVVENNPYPQAVNEPKTLHVSFLGTSEVKPDRKLMNHLKTETEQYKLVNNTFYFYAPDGIGRSKLAAAVEKCLGTPTTSRNWRTVIKLLELADSCEQNS